MEQDFTILIFEDDPNDALLLQHALKKNNINNPVQIVRDGEEGVAYLKGEGHFSDRATYPAPRVILLDLKMPKKNGMEVLEWLKAHPAYKVIPTIVFTSSRENQDIVRAYGLGANCFIVKPSDFDGLLAATQKIHDFWALCEKPRSE